MKATGNVLGVIPARLASTRLPRKPLALIAGKPMVVRVYEGARACQGLRELVVATDAEEIRSVCAEAGIPAVLTSSAHVSGTDRVHEAMQAFPWAEAIVNIQGDEPMVRGAMIDALLGALFSDEARQVATLSTALESTDIHDPSVVKVVAARTGEALYFSRAAIPFARAGQPRYQKHLGYYAYSRAALERFHHLPPSMLEAAEMLEQLRLLENGIGIGVVSVPFDTIAVDTSADLERVEAALRKQSTAPGI